MTALAAFGMALIAAPADAATGILVLSAGPAGPKTVFNNPSAGCRTTSPFTAVTNHTNVSVTVYQGAGCKGGLPLVVPPGAELMPVGDRLSVLVPS
ncbi:hypothetical protein [Nonomuraea sp. NPDC005650]|uniref:hypothetical protein n=1 Tax=Nonomuraea sp. NPDC005650 TaxID=3157045 RepID=UPI0033AAAC39